MNKKRIFEIGLLVFAGTATRLAWPHVYEVIRGVHFRSVPVDFGRPPARYAEAYGTYMSGDGPPYAEPWRPGTRYLDVDYYANERRRKPDPSLPILRTALALEQQGHLEPALSLYAKLNRLGLSDENFLRTRCELLRAALASRDKRGLSEHLSATDPLKKERALPDPAGVARFLKPFLAYEGAARLYDHDKIVEAATEFEKCASEYPLSSRGEPALIMAARCQLSDEREKPNIAAGEADIRRLLGRYPRSRFRPNALGWLGHIAFVEHRYHEAISTYLRQLDEAVSPRDRYLAASSLLQCYQRLGSKDGEAIALLCIYANARNVNDAIVSANGLPNLLSKMSAFEAGRFSYRLKSNPTLLAGYMEIRLHLTPTSQKERADILRIGEACLAETGQRDAALLSHMASLEYSMNRYWEARHHAVAAQRISRKRGNPWALAQYLIASSDKALGKRGKAIREYAGLIRSAPRSYLVGGAHEARASLFDNTGQLEKALDEFYSLNYDADIAYLIDAKMSPAQISHYIAQHPRSAHAKLLWYSLGLRYMRLDKFAAAESCFVKLSRGRREKFAATPFAFDQHWDHPSPRDPLTTARTLAAMRRATRKANTRENKAAALFALASYYYNGSDLMLYNAPLWQGLRADSFDFSWNPKAATRSDDAAIERHHYEHECLAHTVAICHELLCKYPRSRVAAAALYREACALEHLSNFNEWWRWEGRRKHLLSESINMLKSLVSRYPSSPLRINAAKYARVFADESKDDSDKEFWLYEDRRFNYHEAHQP